MRNREQLFVTISRQLSILYTTIIFPLSYLSFIFVFCFNRRALYWAPHCYGVLLLFIFFVLHTSNRPIGQSELRAVLWIWVHSGFIWWCSSLSFAFSFSYNGCNILFAFSVCQRAPDRCLQRVSTRSPRLFLEWLFIIYHSVCAIRVFFSPQVYYCASIDNKWCVVLYCWITRHSVWQCLLKYWLF